MCLTVFPREEKKLAEHDIPCYKIVLRKNRMKYETPYRRMEVRMKKTYKSELRKSYLTVVDIGLHSFRRLDIANQYLNISGMAYTYSEQLCIIECVIPKGSQYYIGTFNGAGAYASTELTYVKKI